ncbi:MAG TPA: PEP-CTERM sorting domain-containing protein, partial [Pyrinomonadaceae bacterium]
FSSVTFVIPPEFFSAPAIRITAPFTFTGVVSTFSPPESALLTGEGTVHVLLVNQTIGGSTGFFLDHADYIFGARASGLTIEPVPEPTTILLLVSGLAGAAARLGFANKRLRK